MSRSRLALGARTPHGSCRLACVPCVVGALRGVGGVGTHVAQHWVQPTGECGSLWLAKYKQIARQSRGWSQLNKYSKISNSCVSFEYSHSTTMCYYLYVWPVTSLRTKTCSTIHFGEMPLLSCPILMVVRIPRLLCYKTKHNSHCNHSHV